MVEYSHKRWYSIRGQGSSGRSWEQWSLDSKIPKPGNLKIEMWPDMADFSEQEKYPVPGFTYPNGEQAHLYSSVNSRTVSRHFEWMREYEIDGIWLQRFMTRLPGGLEEDRYPAFQKVLHNVQEAAQQTGRVWAIAYDMALRPPAYETCNIEIMFSDWKKLVDEGITEDPRYLHHNGKPVLMIWGFYPGAKNAKNITPKVANRIINFFKNDSKYNAFLIGGGNWWWHKDGNTEWAKVFRQFDAFCPWNVPTIKTKNGIKYASTDHWEEGIKEARKAGMLYIPVVWPGFSWNNMHNWPPGHKGHPRRRGDFYWEQWHKAAKLGLDMIYVAMFDEIDEGTPIFKITNQPPIQNYFLSYEGLPSDWYLQLTREGIKMLRHESRITRKIPITPKDLENIDNNKKFSSDSIEIFNGVDLTDWVCGETSWAVKDGILRNVGTGKGTDKITYSKQLPGKSFTLEMRLRVKRCTNDYPRPRIWLVGAPSFRLGNEGMKYQFEIYGTDLKYITQIGDDSYSVGDWYDLRIEVDDKNRVLFYKDGVITHFARRVKKKPLKITISPGDGWSAGHIEISSIKYTPKIKTASEVFLQTELYINDLLAKASADRLIDKQTLGVEKGKQPAKYTSGSLKHVIVYKQAGRFCGWPNNNGMWIWDNEMLVGFSLAYYKANKSGYDHSMDRSKPRHAVKARSLDGGETWKLERPIAFRTHYQKKNTKYLSCPTQINFTHPDFAMVGHSSNFYFSYNRGKIWKGPYKLSTFGQKRITMGARNDYIVNGKNDCFISITASKRADRKHGRPLWGHTIDGGITWNFVSWMTPESNGSSIMPSTVRLSQNRLISAIRRQEKPLFFIEIYFSDDNGKTWKFLSKIGSTGKANGNPPSMVRLKDGRIVVTYGYRAKPYGIRAKISCDNGKTWSKVIHLRDDGLSWDLGYPQMVQRPDGKIVTVYYFTTKENPEQHIAATIWDPDKITSMISEKNEETTPVPISNQSNNQSEAPGVIIDYSPAESGKYIGSPSLAVLPSGDYIASHDFFGPGSEKNHTAILRSGDAGKTWQHLTDINRQWWSTLFVHNKDLYIMGVDKRFGNVAIRWSTDGGKTWTIPTDRKSGLLATGGRYHTAPVPVTVHKGRIWRAMEDIYPKIK